MKTLKDSWQASLSRVLDRTNSPEIATRLAVVGIGNELNGDDAAGVLIVRKLCPLFKDHPHIKVYEAGQALENITGNLIRFKPDMILFIDALSIGATPGSIHMLDWRLSQGFMASTHTLPIRLTVQYLLNEISCVVYLLGVQVKDTGFDIPLSKTVENSVTEIVILFKRWSERMEDL